VSPVLYVLALSRDEARALAMLLDAYLATETADPALPTLRKILRDIQRQGAP
jgi:hypothetical protein